MPAYGYIRQSARVSSDKALSPQAQLEAIQRLASRYGDDPNSLVILTDLGRSGALEKTHLRKSYNDLLAAIKSNGHGTTIYALSMSRLARSLSELLKVFSLASEHGVRIVFEKEGELRFDTPTGKLHATIIGAVYEFERELAVDRQRDNMAIRKARGDQLGRKPYENTQVVIDAYKETGSFHATARLLNQRSIPSWSGKAWTPRTISKMVEKNAPSLIRKGQGRGAKMKSNSFTFYRLLKCSCGTILTGSTERSGRVIYRCHKQSLDPNHSPKYFIAESDIKEQVSAELGDITRLDFTVDVEVDQDYKAQLEDKRSRVIETYMEGLISKKDRDARLADIDAELSKLVKTSETISVPDWDDAPVVMNEFLRGMFGTIQLDKQMQPTFDWLVNVRGLKDLTTSK